jgi:hypothetical protein
MQPRSSKAGGGVDTRRGDNASERSDTIMLQNDEKRVLAASGAIEIFNEIELSGQSKHPHAVRK